MAFNKFEPHAPDVEEPEIPEHVRGKVWLLRWGWWITMAYTAMGFGLIVYWML